MIKFYDPALSGNCHKVRMMLGFLDLDYEVVPVNWATGEHKEDRYREINPRAQLPTFYDNSIVIWDSQAILGYLARTYDESGCWFPNDPLTLARVMQWLQMADEEVAALAWARVTVLMKQPRDRLDELQSKSRAGLCVMNEQLADHSRLAGTDHPTIGDVACFPYAGMAEQGEVAFSDYPHAQRWRRAVTALPGYIPMPGLEA